MQVVFRLAKAQTKFGDTIMIVGNVDALGKWNPANAVKMVYKEGMWVTQTRIEVDHQLDAANIEYKYVQCHKNLSL